MPTPNTTADPLMVAVTTYHDGVERQGLGARDAMRRALDAAGFTDAAAQQERVRGEIAEIRQRLDQLPSLAAAA